MDNVIFIEFFNKENFPPGKWKNEPDICSWIRGDYHCLALRDMSIGTWKGFVGLSKNHKFYLKSLKNILRTKIGKSLNKSLFFAGKLPPRFKEYDKNLWWIGVESFDKDDVMPFVKTEENSEIVYIKKYKDLPFILKKVNVFVDNFSELT